MIDEYWTWIFYGYHSDDLKSQSNKCIVAICDNCFKYRIIRMSSYRDLCIKCSQIGKKMPPVTDKTRIKMSISAKNKPPITDEHRQNLRNAAINKIISPRTKEWRDNLSKAHKGKSNGPQSYKTKQKISATLQGITIEEWDGFYTTTQYCTKFNNTCREQNRNKYDRLCFLCSKTEKENGRKLSVHHIDMNKNQGCDDHDWMLVPLCMICHGTVHTKTWTSRIKYLLNHQ